MMEKVLAVLILVIWLVKVNRYGGDKSAGPSQNIFFSCAVCVVQGLRYCISMWPLFLQ